MLAASVVVSTGFVSSSVAHAAPAAPTGVKIEVNTKNLTVRWGARTGATWHLFFINQEGTTVSLGSTTRNSYVINTALEGFIANSSGKVQVFVAQCAEAGSGAFDLPPGVFDGQVAVACAPGQLGEWGSASVTTIPKVDIMPELNGRKLSWEPYGWFGNLTFSKFVIEWGKSNRALTGKRTVNGTTLSTKLPKFTRGYWDVWVKAYVGSKMVGKQLIETYVR